MSLSRRPLALGAVAAVALGLAACENGIGFAPPGTGVAEVVSESPQEASANIASLTDVVAAQSQQRRGL